MTFPIAQLGPRGPLDIGYSRIQLGTWLAGVYTVAPSQPTIKTITAAVSPTTATITDLQVIGTNVYVVLSGGTPGVSNTITLTITLSDNQVFQRSAVQPCEAGM